jgi:hypothetical protein
MSQEFPLDPEELAETIGIPLKDWPGNCHAVATAVLRKVPVAGMRIVRGHYHGYVSSASVYRGSLQQHSWLEADDGRILDPTRWAMTSPNHPHIYLGENDAYDEAGLMLRARMKPHTAMATFLSGDAGAEQAILKRLEKLTPAAIAQVFEAGGLSTPQDDLSLRDAERLRSRMEDPVEHFRDPAPFFEALRETGLGALVPFDTMQRVLQPEEVTVDRGANMLYDLPRAEALTEHQKLFKVLCRFLSIEARDGIEGELEQINYSLHELHDALNQMERRLRFDPEEPYFRSETATVVALVAFELLGNGFGAELEVERYARSIGMDRDALHCALVSFGDRAGYDLAWLIGEEAALAEAARTLEPDAGISL